ncbi:MAG: hypothetical protein WA151_18840 [Desulfatirhabdiaceae bacterium]
MCNYSELGIAMDALVTLESRTGKYQRVKETIIIACSVHPRYKRVNGVAFPFVRLSAIPEKFHAHILEASIGSNRPAPDDLHDAYWLAGIDRWLRAIGVQAEFIEPSQD